MRKRTTRSLAGAALGMLSVAALAQHPAAPVPNPLEPAATGGVAVVDRALAKLSTHKRLLVVGAHPDDEDTGLLTLVASGMGGESAYLSLSRGDGGQNLIGAELGVGLGVLRSGELVAARQIEGGRQFFTRAYDFGYTRSLEETLERWPEAMLQEDAVRVVRRFMPQVIVSVFPDDGRGGHGQHQAAGRIAHQLPALAADLETVSLAGEGLPAWTVSALYRKTWWDPEAATLHEPLGLVEPFSGRSIRQLAAASRSLHRSQDMGRAQELGGDDSTAAWVAGALGENGDRLFSGIDTRLVAIAASIEDEALRSRVAFKLVNVETAARASRRTLTPSDPAAAAPAFRRAIQLLTETEDILGSSDDEFGAVRSLVREKRFVAEAGLAAALGLAVDVAVEAERIPAGSTFPVVAEAWNSGAEEVHITGVRWETASGWEVGESHQVVEEEDADSGAGVPLVSGPLVAGELRVWSADVHVASEAPVTAPYFLRRPLSGDVYSWDEAPTPWWGVPFEPPPLVLVLDLESEGVRFSVRREVVARSVVQELGEVRRPLHGLPRLEVSVAPARILWRLNGADTRDLMVTVDSNVDVAVRGVVWVNAPQGWAAPAAMPFEIVEPRGVVALSIPIQRPAGAEAGQVEFNVAAVTEDGARYDIGYPVLDYEHVRPRLLPEPARADVSVLDLELPDLGRIGYLRGAADRVPEALLEMGFDVEVLDPSELAQGGGGRLDGFDAIVVGPRAYETDPAVGTVSPRLLDYVRSGGLLLVQYQQYQFAGGGYTPFPMEIARPHGRVTDETAAVKPLEPQHGVFNRPNRIVAGDWDGWVQERGLYFADSWDAAFRPLIELADAGQDPQRGALLVATLGEGTYVYTGLAFFRQLPVGVAGAARLFANLMALEVSE